MENKHPKDYFGITPRRATVGYHGVPITNNIKPPEKINTRPATVNSRNSLELCIHNKGKTGGKVGTGCKKEDEYSCALHGFCILNACSYSGTRTICSKCPNFKHPDSEEAKNYLEELAKMEAQEKEQKEVSSELIENLYLEDSDVEN